MNLFEIVFLFELNTGIGIGISLFNPFPLCLICLIHHNYLTL